MRAELAVFIDETGVKKVIPSADTLAETERVMVLYKLIAKDLDRLNEVIRQRTGRRLASDDEAEEEVDDVVVVTGT
jgi:hypothetical protein